LECFKFKIRDRKDEGNEEIEVIIVDEVNNEDCVDG